MGLLRRSVAAIRRIDRVWVDWLPVAGLLALSQFDPNLVGAKPVASPLLLGLFAVATTLPLGWRRRHPMATAVAISAAVAGWALAFGPVLSLSSFLAMVLAMFAVGAHADRRQTIVSVAATAMAAIVVTLTLEEPAPALDWVFPVLYFGGALLLGRGMRRREERTRLLSQLNADLERERDRSAGFAAAEERARIARELHDVIAHGVGVMVVQAEAAEEILTADPDQARRSLQQIQTSGREALAELRQLLGVLRPHTDDHPDAARRDMAALAALSERITGTGLRVHLRVEGRPRPLPTALEQTVYRIVQEALTNTQKHANASSAQVWIRYRPDHLEIEVTDDGREPPAAHEPTGGHGLIGMRERVGAYHGTLTAGRADGGFTVRAVLPTDNLP